MNLHGQVTKVLTNAIHPYFIENVGIKGSQQSIVHPVSRPKSESDTVNVLLYTCKQSEIYCKFQWQFLNYTERIKFSNFLKCLYCCRFEKYYNAADRIQLV